MRTIKFRAWDKKEKKMLDWDFLVKQQGTYLNSNFFEAMQYIGHTDKNDKEIYEGDIVKHPKHKGINSLSKTEFSIFCVEWIIQDNNMSIEPFNSCPDCSGSYYASLSEVIGNIYEDEHLLTK